MRSILMLAKAFPPVVGGIETYSEFVARAYVALGYRVIVVTQFDKPVGEEERIYPEGTLSVHNVGGGAGGQIRTFVRMLAHARRLMKRTHFEICHATTWRPALVHFFAGRRIPLVVTVHGREIVNCPRYLRGFLARVLSRAIGVMAVSAPTLEVAQSALSKRASEVRWYVNHNGITYPNLAAKMTRSSSSEEEPVRFLSLARLVPRKNIQGCLHALGALKRAGCPPFRYRIAGKGPMMEKLKRVAEEENLSREVTFLGYVSDSDIPELYRHSDVFLHPQIALENGKDFEGFGLVIADAMSFGNVVIAGANGGPRDFIKHGKTGLLVDGGDQQALRKAIARLLHDRCLIASLGKEAQRFSIANLSWNRHVERVAALAQDHQRGGDWAAE